MKILPSASTTISASKRFFTKSLVIKSLFIQTGIFIALFFALTWFQERGMLVINSQVAQASQISPTDLAPQPLDTLTGEKITLQAQGKTTVIYFFAPWCSVCHLSISNLQATFDSNTEVNIIAVALDYENKEAVQAFVNEHQLKFPIALGTKAVKEKFKIKAYPSYYVIDTNNKIVARSVGYSTELGIFLRTL